MSSSAPAEDEDLVGDQVPRPARPACRRSRPPCRSHRDHAVAVGVLGIHLGGDHRDRRARRLLLDQRAVVLDVDGVGAHHDERLGPELADQRRVAPQRVGGALWKPSAVAVPSRGCRTSSPPTVRSRSQGRPLDRWSLSEIALNCCEIQTSGPGVVAVAEREVDQPVRPGVGHGGLRAVAREQLQPPAGAAGEHDDQRPDPRHAGGPTRRAPEAAPSARPGTCPRAAPRSSPACWPPPWACRPRATAHRPRCR